MNKSELSEGPGKPWLAVASKEEFEQYLETIDKKLAESGGRSVADQFKDVVDSLSEDEKDVYRERMIKIYEKYQGPGGP